MEGNMAKLRIELLELAGVPDKAIVVEVDGDGDLVLRHDDYRIFLALDEAELLVDAINLVLQVHRGHFGEAPW
jgi:hypothetical protein